MGPQRLYQITLMLPFVKQHSESVTILILSFSHSSATKFQHLPWQPQHLASVFKENCLWSESWVFCFSISLLFAALANLLYMPSKQLCWLWPGSLTAALYYSCSLPKRWSALQPCIHTLLFLFWLCSGPLRPNWDFARVPSKLNYCTSKGHSHPQSLVQMMKLLFSFLMMPLKQA